jgi:hypothetical protein
MKAMAETTIKPEQNSSGILICGMAELLKDVPLHSPRQLAHFFHFPDEIRVHCDDAECTGIRLHKKFNEQNFVFHWKAVKYFTVSYNCSNCTFGAKAFIIRLEEGSGVCTKIYQEPGFGQPIPKRLFHIIDETNREYFLQARRAIARGLGIGAYSYYRRIIENKKFDLVGSVLEVAQATNASSDQIELLKKAQVETQFSKAIDMLRDVSAIPAVLLINGHNPLSIVHDLLSEGIHKLTDAECLERAQQAEIILCEVANRMQIAVTEQKTVKDALTSILNRKYSAPPATS